MDPSLRPRLTERAGNLDSLLPLAPEVSILTPSTPYQVTRRALILPSLIACGSPDDCFRLQIWNWLSAALHGALGVSACTGTSDQGRLPFRRLIIQPLAMRSEDALIPARAAGTILDSSAPCCTPRSGKHIRVAQWWR